MMDDRNINRRKAVRIFLNIGLMVLTVLLVATFTSEPAQAWGRKKAKKKTEKVRKAVNRNQHPDYRLFRGVLRKDHLGNWFLDKRPMSFNRNSRITPEGGPEEEPVLIEGRTALVTAAEINGELIVRRVSMVSVDELLKRGGFNTGEQSEEPAVMDPGTPR